MNIASPITEQPLIIEISVQLIAFDGWEGVWDGEGERVKGWNVRGVWVAFVEVVVVVVVAGEWAEVWGDEESGWSVRGVWTVVVVVVVDAPVDVDLGNGVVVVLWVWGDEVAVVVVTVVDDDDDDDEVLDDFVVPGDDFVVPGDDFVVFEVIFVEICDGVGAGVGLALVVLKSQSGKPVKPSDGFITSGSLSSPMALMTWWHDMMNKDIKNNFEKIPIFTQFLTV